MTKYDLVVVKKTFRYFPGAVSQATNGAFNSAVIFAISMGFLVMGVSCFASGTSDTQVNGAELVGFSVALLLASQACASVGYKSWNKRLVISNRKIIAYNGNVPVSAETSDVADIELRPQNNMARFLKANVWTAYIRLKDDSGFYAESIMGGPDVLTPPGPNLIAKVNEIRESIGIRTLSPVTANHELGTPMIASEFASLNGRKLNRSG